MSKDKKGQSGNPNGRPKGALGKKTIEKQKLNDTLDMIQAGEASFDDVKSDMKAVEVLELIMNLQFQAGDLDAAKDAAKELARYQTPQLSSQDITQTTRQAPTAVSIKQLSHKGNSSDKKVTAIDTRKES